MVAPRCVRARPFSLCGAARDTALKYHARARSPDPSIGYSGRETRRPYPGSNSVTDHLVQEKKDPRPRSRGPALQADRPRRARFVPYDMFWKAVL